MVFRFVRFVLVVTDIERLRIDIDLNEKPSVSSRDANALDIVEPIDVNLNFCNAAGKNVGL